jgi:hypothetical protein
MWNADSQISMAAHPVVLHRLPTLPVTTVAPGLQQKITITDAPATKKDKSKEKASKKHKHDDDDKDDAKQDKDASKKEKEKNKKGECRSEWRARARNFSKLLSFVDVATHDSKRPLSRTPHLISFKSRTIIDRNRSLSTLFLSMLCFDFDRCRYTHHSSAILAASIHNRSTFFQKRFQLTEILYYFGRG